MEFIVCSREQAKKLSYKLCDPTLIVSITDPDKSPNQFANNSCIRAVCRVSFDDILAYEEGNGLIAMRPSDAKKIRECVDRYMKEVRCILVHCEAGVSRSAGIMAAIQKYIIGSDNVIFDSPQYRPNIHCYRTMMNEFFS